MLPNNHSRHFALWAHEQQQAPINTCSIDWEYHSPVHHSVTEEGAARTRAQLGGSAGEAPVVNARKPMPAHYRDPLHSKAKHIPSQYPHVRIANIQPRKRIENNAHKKMNAHFLIMSAAKQIPCPSPLPRDADTLLDVHLRAPKQEKCSCFQHLIASELHSRPCQACKEPWRLDMPPPESEKHFSKCRSWTRNQGQHHRLLTASCRTPYALKNGSYLPARYSEP